MTQQPEIANRETQKRQVARIVKLSDLTSGEYIQQTGWLPNFVKTQTGVEASRVNIIGILTEISPADITPFVAVDQFSAMLDDGSEKMQLRSFEPIVFADALQVGVPVLVIARPKKYSGELFLVPEIIRKLPDKKWLEVRKATLDATSSKIEIKKPEPTASRVEAIVTAMPQAKSEVRKSDVKPKQAVVETEDDEPVDGADEVEHLEKPSENVLDIINRLDSGDGVLVAEAVAEIKAVRPEIDGQKRILALLLSGDVFEMRPGRIKVLK